MNLTTVPISPDYSKKLYKIAEADKRSKTQQLHTLIDEEYTRRGWKN